MLSRLRAALVVSTTLAILLAAGCKGGPGATRGEPSSTKTAEAKTHDQEAKSEEKAKPKVADILKQLQSTRDSDQISGLIAASELVTDAERAPLKEPIKRLTRSENPDVQVSAIAAWLPWVKSDPEPPLRGANSPHMKVRLASVRLLEFGQPSAVQNTVARLKNDPDSSVAQAASAALAAILSASKQDTGVDLLIADLGHPEGDRSAQAAQRLEQAARTNRRIIDRLAVTLAQSKRPAQRRSCAVVISLASAGVSPGQEAFSARCKATYRVEAKTDPAYTAAVPALSKALVSDPDPMVREAAAEGLGVIGAPGAAPALAKALKDPDAYVRRRAASALIVVPPDPVKEALRAAAREDRVPAVRRFAVEALAGLSDQRDAALTVATCLDDSDADVRRYACEVLSRIGTATLTPALLPLFQDPDEDVRWKAVEAVSAFSDPDAKGALSEALWDDSPRVALAAERGLHNLGIGKRVLTAEERTGKAVPQ
jgi:HEAT repeat protein